MKRAALSCLALAALGLAFVDLTHTPLSGQQPAGDAPPKKFPDFDTVVKGAKEYEGLFRLHQKDDHLFAEIRPDQLDKPMLCPIAIARGMGMGGYTLNFDEQWVLVFKKVGDKVQLIRRNVHFQAKRGTPLAKAVETTYEDSVLMALKIHSIHPVRQTVLIDLNDIFMTDFAQLGIGSFDANRSSWAKVKTFPRNLELEVQATYAGRAGGGSVIDGRGTTIVIHYSLMQMPDDGYQPRVADDRIGYFLTAHKDFTGADSKDTAFVRYINRWRLERADTDPKNAGKLSAPKKKIVYWIEKSVPEEYRAYVREGILEWNKAFEKIGFRDAIEVRQQENEDFDPEDVNYSTFRWIASDGGFAMGPSRVNPFTGEILDADIIFDASMVRYWKQEADVYPGEKKEPASTIQAGRLGLGLEDHPLFELTRGLDKGWSNPRQRELAENPAAWAIRQGACLCGTHMRYELGMGAMALAAREAMKAGEKVPEELIGQAIKEVVMHEVGHTLGLRHNFKASTMLKNEQLHDTTITRKQGLVGSVMDYTPINLAPKGVKQGDYFTTTIGPYDYLAIEYGYKPLAGGTEGEVEKLQEIASRASTPGNDYGTDEDLYGTNDPLINLWDLGADPMQFGKDRMLLAEEILKTLADKIVEKGEGYQRARQAFSVLLSQYGNAAHLVANFVGGEYVHRDHRGDPGNRDPMAPVNGVKQREALRFLQEHILSDKPFQFSPVLLRKLAADRWNHWGNDRVMVGSVEYPLHERILAIQRVVLGQLLEGGTLSRIQNNSLKTEKDDQPLTVAEVFRTLSDSTWGDLPADSAKPEETKAYVSSSIIRRNLQRDYLKDLTRIVTGNGSALSGRGTSMPPDARSLARMHLKEIQKRILIALNSKAPVADDTTRAHLEESQERIAKALTASMQANEP
jgi:hypothetical protein